MDLKLPTKHPQNMTRTQCAPPCIPTRNQSRCCKQTPNKRARDVPSWGLPPCQRKRTRCWPRSVCRCLKLAAAKQQRQVQVGKVGALSLSCLPQNARHLQDKTCSAQPKLHATKKCGGRAPSRHKLTISEHTATTPARHAENSCNFNGTPSSCGWSMRPSKVLTLGVNQLTANAILHTHALHE